MLTELKQIPVNFRGMFSTTKSIEIIAIFPLSVPKLYAREHKFNTVEVIGTENKRPSEKQVHYSGVIRHVA